MNLFPLLAWIGFATATVGILLAPFVPCWREWKSPTDFSPLSIVREEVNDVDYFADAFRILMTDDGNAMATDPPFHRMAGSSAAFPWASAQQPVKVSGPLYAGEPLVCPKAVYSSADVFLASSAHLPALLCEGNAVLGPGTRISGWAHAGGTLSLGQDSVVLHRLTAGNALILRHGTGFCRLHAPTIHFGEIEDSAATPVAETHGLSPAWPSPDLLPCGIDRYRSTSDVRFPAGHHLQGTLIATGRIWLEDGTAIFGGVKSRKHIRMEKGVQVHGALVCEGDIEIGPDCWIKGPVISEGDVWIGPGARIGTRQTPTTVTARRVLADTGVTAHGTVWARHAGVVAA